MHLQNIYRAILLQMHGSLVLLREHYFELHISCQVGFWRVSRSLSCSQNECVILHWQDPLLSHSVPGVQESQIGSGRDSVSI